MGDLLIIRSVMNRFLYEGFDRDIIKICLAFFYQPCPWYFRDIQADSQLILQIIQLSMIADELLPNDVVLFI